MLSGFSGHLLSESFLSTRIARVSESAEPARGRFADALRQARTLGPASSLRAMIDAGAAPLLVSLGFEPLTDSRIEADLARGTLLLGSERAALLVVPWGERLDRFWRDAVQHAIASNRDWCVAFNGTHLRIVDPRRPYSRRYVEFEVDALADDERTFAACWLVMRQMGPLLDQLVAASNRHGIAVCRSLRDGVLTASTNILAALAPGSKRGTPRPLADAFEQALTIVYRILFLLFAEARQLVPLWHPVYHDSYSLEALCALAERQPATGLWQTLRAIGRLAHAGCEAGDLRVTPFNGRLFSPARTPLAERPHVDDEAARRALVALSTAPSADRSGRERIAYRDLGVEQLGAVYETLLDYQPRAHPDRRVTLETGSGLRKKTGTFYTPVPIADYLVQRTLAPLTATATPERILELRVVDPAMGSGAFLVAACRYLERAYEAALEAHGRCHASDIGPLERASIRRTIAERCLFGVDLNPMAVQLARLSLWLATLAADRPLTFLDHHLQAGDSVVGAWLSNLRRPPQATKRRPADASTPGLFDDNVRTVLKDVLPVRFSLESVSGDALAQVRAKERALAALDRPESPLSRWKRVADLWCACWFASGEGTLPAAAFQALSDRLLAGRGPLADRSAALYLQTAADLSASQQFFHWELEFPEVFFDAQGNRRDDAGFDAVIGNPPWEMLRADHGSRPSRLSSRDRLARLVRFVHDAGIYGSQSNGHPNWYQLFTERAVTLSRPGGRIGLVLPAGIASDHGSAALRRRLLADCDIDALITFDNRRGVFPIHRSVRFGLLTATAGMPTHTIACRLGEHDPDMLDRLGSHDTTDRSAAFPIALTPALIHRLSGDDLSIPELRLPVDLVIAERATTLFPPLGSDQSWSARFGRELNATDDRQHFVVAGSGLPVVEGKHLEPFRLRLPPHHRRLTRHAAAKVIGRRLTLRRRLAYRDVASATNRLTLIAAVLPAECVSVHTVFCLRTPLALGAQYFLSGLFNSFVVNYLVRMRVTTHVTTAIVERLPVPRRQDSLRAFRTIAALARGLERRPDTSRLAQLQAEVARLYQLSAIEFQHVLDTFPLVPIDERRGAFQAFITG